MKEYSLEMREDTISKEIIDNGIYSVLCGGVDIILECEDQCGEYFLRAYNIDYECIDFKVVGLGTASRILAYEEELGEKVKYLSTKKSGLDPSICKDALSIPFIGSCL